jgi:hypothetical protein
MDTLKIVMAGIAGGAFVIGVPGAADAKITCSQGYQRVAGNWLATPYCQDAYVAEVAGQYGMRVSAAKIRNNPHYKRDVCLVVGNDIRVKDTCDNVLSRDHSIR